MTQSNKIHIPRRAILAGIGAAGAGMFLRPLFASAQEKASPTRLLIVHRPCGTRMERFFPQGGDNKNFTFPEISKSFEPLKDNLVFLNNVSCPRDNGWVGDKHSAGLITMMTGKRFIGIPGTDSIVGANADQNAKNLTAAGKSIDQLLLSKSDKLKGTQIPSIQATAFRPSSTGLPAFRVMSYDDANSPIFPESRPGVLFDSIFGAGLGLTADALARMRAQNTSILDFVHGDLARLKSHLPQSQLEKLDKHLAGIESLQAGISTSGVSPGAMCSSKPNQVALPAITGDLSIDEAQHLAVAKNQLGIISAAFQCDLTRVATFTFAHGNSTLQWKKMVSGFPTGGGHHDISHNTDATDAQARIDQIYCETLAATLLEMKNIKEGAGTMLDNTLVVMFNEVSDGNSHGTDDMPLVMFGGKSIGLQTGQHLRFNKRSMTDVWSAVGQAFGVDMTGFGDKPYATGAVSNLFA